ncbi:MAG: sugar transferase [bacterium]|nr:sugar transferase [bacterium]
MTLKRAFDLLCVVPGLLLLLPLMAVLALCIKLDSKGPILFCQTRMGRMGKPFTIYKFRTMVEDAEGRGLQLTVRADPRITCYGRLLRDLKLDELPQLFNVLKGDMSLVGPRPEVPRYVECYTPEQRKVLALMPGITDPASIKYRDESGLLATAEAPEKAYISEIMPEKIRLNLEYAVGSSVWTDFKIIIYTLLKIFRR